MSPKPSKWCFGKWTHKPFVSLSFRKELENLTSSQEFKEAVQEYKDKGLLNRDGAFVKDTPFYNAVRKIFARAKERAMTQLRYEYPDLDERLALIKAKKKYTKEGNLNNVQYLIQRFPK